jgi:hypothetical protein
MFLCVWLVLLYPSNRIFLQKHSPLTYSYLKKCDAINPKFQGHHTN